MSPETETLRNELASLKADIEKACGLPGFNLDVAIRKLQEHGDVMRFKVAAAEAIGLRLPHVSCDRVLQEVRSRVAPTGTRKIVRISGGIGQGISCICDDGTAWRYVRKYTDDAIACEGWEMLEPIPQGDCVISLAPRPLPEPPR